jgi:hypothetical protein
MPNLLKQLAIEFKLAARKFCQRLIRVSALPGEEKVVTGLGYLVK